jgi:hypothetical protein
MRYDDEFDETLYVEHSMESVLEIHDLEEENILTIVCYHTKCDPWIYDTKGHHLSPWHYFGDRAPWRA